MPHFPRKSRKFPDFPSVTVTGVDVTGIVIGVGGSRDARIAIGALRREQAAPGIEKKQDVLRRRTQLHLHVVLGFVPNADANYSGTSSSLHKSLTRGLEGW
ncbi:hypothetical protein R1sor_004102 [Riccia sorocarpa]|uniref:Uncharacterized protein n=1 Tax=Riccia sorocarpa TaxID=122646 RepID=A0ABD3H6V0_9MARC